MARARVTPAQLKRQLEQLLCSLTTPQAWENLISAADNLGQYTARNRALILTQYPQATSLAGSATWDVYGRRPAEGQHALCLVAVTRPAGSGNARNSQADADVLAPDLRPPHEQEPPSPAESGQARERYRGQTGATVVKVWDVRQTEKFVACVACESPAEAPCAPGCRGLPNAPTQPVHPAEWWQLVEELPEGVDPHPVWNALGETAFLV